MRKVIGFVTAGLKFDGSTINKSALGGSESAMYYMARELSRLGNDVYVFCDCDTPGIYENVVYDSNKRFKDKQYPQLDVCIISRYLEFYQKPIDSNYNVYWVHDVPFTKLYNQMWQVEEIFCMSEYQKELYSEEKYISELMHVTKNGFDRDLADATEIRTFDKKKNHYIYASRPERGLKLLLEKIWPRVLEKNPLAQLHLCGYDNTLPQVEQHKELYDSINKLKDSLDNIVDHGALTKQQYYTLLGKCGYMLYPTDFPEISCINAIEAQAMECLVISSKRYAVLETVKSDTLIEADYGTDEYVHDFMSKLDHYLDPVNYDIEVKLAKKEIAEYSWSEIAKTWDYHFDLKFVQRMDKYLYQVVNRLVYNSDIYAAWKLTGDSGYRHILDCAARNNLNYDIAVEAADIGVDPDTNARIRSICELAKKYINKDKMYEVLDLGCFTGLISTGLFRHVGNNISKYYAYDGNKQALDLFKQHRDDPRVTYINDNVKNVLKHDIKADLVICGEILEHVEDTVGFLDMLMEVARPDTVFIFTTPYGPWESIMLRQKPEKRDELYNHVHHFEFHDLMHIFQDVHDTFFITRPYDVRYSGRGDSLEHWVYGFKFNKKPKFYTVNYEEKAMRTRPYFSISTCMITKNEEINLARCLNSVKSISDEIIIVDTGSTDSTKTIAKKYTDKIYDYEWNGSFEDARNYSLSKSTCDWVLYIDADEELFDSTILGKLVETEFYDGVIVEQRQVSVNGDTTNENQNPTRLFRNNGKIKFYGIIHELPGFNENDFVEKSLNQREAYIAHYGYMNKDIIMTDKLDRNHAALLKDLEKYPNRLFGKTYYIRDMYFMFLRELVNKNKPNYYFIDEMLSTWDKEFRGKTVDHVQWNFAKMFAHSFVQGLYQDMAKNNIGIDGVLPFKKTINFKDAAPSDIWFRDNKEYQEFVEETKQHIDTDEEVLELVPILSAKYINNNETAVVPCGTCSVCCRTADAYLTDEEVVSGKYVVEFVPQKMVKGIANRNLPPNTGVFRLARTNDNACFYLRNNVCTIYDSRPRVCRQFDCRTCKDPNEQVAQVMREKFNINI